MTQKSPRKVRNVWEMLQARFKSIVRNSLERTLNGKISRLESNVQVLVAEISRISQNIIKFVNKSCPILAEILSRPANYVLYLITISPRKTGIHVTSTAPLRL